MTLKTLLLCDLDGVLLDSESDLSWLERSIEKTLTHFKIPLTDEHINHLHFANIEKFRQISLNLGIDPKILWPIRNKYYTKEKLLAMKQGIITPFPDVIELYQLKSMFYMGIISNSPQIVVDSFVSLFHFSDLFTFNIGRGRTIWDIEHLKPDPHLFLQMKKHTDVTAILYIGDRESDREFAHKTKMTYYHLDRERKSKNSYATLLEIVQILKKTGMD